jgi:hypothetical protein
MPNEVIARVPTTAKEFNYIDIQSENQFIQCSVYCDDYGNHTMALRPEIFRDKIIPLFGPGWFLKVKRILDVPFNDDMEIVITRRHITLEQKPPKWKPVTPPTGIRPLVVCLHGCLDRDTVGSYLWEAKRHIMGPISAFAGPMERITSWRCGIEDKTIWPDENQSAILFDTEDGRTWLGKAIQASRSAGAVFIRQGYTTLAWDWERLIEGIAARLRPYAPIYELPEESLEEDVSPAWHAAWDSAMTDLHSKRGTTPKLIEKR